MKARPHGERTSPRSRQRHHRQHEQAEIVIAQRRRRRQAEEARPRHAVDALGSVGQPGLVAEDEKRQRRKGESDEGEVVVLDAQRGVAEQPADDEAKRQGEHDGGQERPALRRQDRPAIGADADERALREGDLASVAKSEIEPDRGDRHHRPLGEDVESVAMKPERRQDEQSQRDRHAGIGQARARGLAHTVRSSPRPSNPLGRNRMMTISRNSGIAPRYCVDR